MHAAEAVAETLGEDDTDGPGNADLIGTRELEALIDAWAETA